jgi:hypothetical protein
MILAMAISFSKTDLSSAARALPERQRKEMITLAAHTLSAHQARVRLVAVQNAINLHLGCFDAVDIACSRVLVLLVSADRREGIQKVGHVLQGAKQVMTGAGNAVNVRENLHGALDEVLNFLSETTGLKKKRLVSSSDIFSGAQAERWHTEAITTSRYIV